VLVRLRPLGRRTVHRPLERPAVDTHDDAAPPPEGWARELVEVALRADPHGHRAPALEPVPDLTARVRLVDDLPDRDRRVPDGPVRVAVHHGDANERGGAGPRTGLLLGPFGPRRAARLLRRAARGGHGRQDGRDGGAAQGHVWLGSETSANGTRVPSASARRVSPEK
jgi:hypothetical protein